MHQKKQLKLASIDTQSSDEEGNDPDELLDEFKLSMTLARRF